MESEKGADGPGREGGNRTVRRGCQNGHVGDRADSVMVCQCGTGCKVTSCYAPLLCTVPVESLPTASAYLGTDYLIQPPPHLVAVALQIKSSAQ